MKLNRCILSVAVAAFWAAPSAFAAVDAAEAAKLATSLTPFGAERAANKDGSIPAWTGGVTTAQPGFKNGGKRPDLFASDKPLYTVTAKNLSQYADKLTEGQQQMLKKFPDTYRIDVYPSRRSAAAPQWVYDNTVKNATRAKLVESSGGPMPQGAHGGIPFPIPQTGAEVVWNHLLRWRGESWRTDFRDYVLTSDGKVVYVLDAVWDQEMPYYYKEGNPESYKNEYNINRLINAGPAVRAGEGFVGRNSLNPDNDQAWLYLTGQRRVRKLPNACCDTPATSTAGLMTFDELEVFYGRMGRMDWKLLGKKEMLIPYNSNRSLAPAKDADMITNRHLNPDHVRWELHRVWVVEAKVKEGQRHQTPRSVYYFDEDTWYAVLGDRWDNKGQLWKTLWQLPIVAPDLPGVVAPTFGFYDLLSGAAFMAGIFNEKRSQYEIMPRYQDSTFTPDGLAAQGIR